MPNQRAGIIELSDRADRAYAEVFRLAFRSATWIDQSLD
jgi:hypothetical protein